MTNRETLWEQYDDARFALLMDEVIRQESARLEELNQSLSADPSAALPESAERRCRQTMDRFFAGQRRRHRRQASRRIFHRVAMAAAVAALMFTTAFALSEDFRVSTMNLLITVEEQYTELTMRPADETPQEPQNEAELAYFENLEIGWLPEGFTCTTTIPNQQAEFRDGTGLSLVISLYALEDAPAADTDGADRTETLSLNGLDALLVEKDGATTCCVTDTENGVCFTVWTSDGIDPAVSQKIAENLRYVQPEDWPVFEDLEVGWIPSGYTLEANYPNSLYGYTNPDGTYFIIDRSSGSGNMDIDTEDADQIDHLTINGMDTLRVFKKGIIHTVMMDTEHNLIYRVWTSAGIPLEVNQKIAESMHYVEPAEPEPAQGPLVPDLAHVEVGWVPDGFVCGLSTPGSYAGYRNESGAVININVETGNKKVLNTEDADSVDTGLCINGREAVRICKAGYMECVVMEPAYDLYVHVWTDGISQEDNQKIAENLRFFD
ncbi:DUF4367 domain-containing protein [uncultured Oscillibacter sp.]|uniref:DUF4367 domain-containing protein n=1 Tax=uncultured Oscillibacter sp. TaxID=876091 RepID=UPI0025E539E3|nr:DUF4367 domain-containing protein [uncultured Oscillibacter sp.]